MSLRSFLIPETYVSGIILCFPSNIGEILTICGKKACKNTTKTVFHYKKTVSIPFCNAI